MDDDVLPRSDIRLYRRDRFRLWLRRKWYDVRLAAHDLWERIVW